MNGENKPENEALAAARADTQLTASNIFSSFQAFELAGRMANAFSKSTIVPKEYQGNAANCLIALEMANRLGSGPMMVMQNLHVINGRPGWSSQFIIAMINNSGRYKTELQYEIKGAGDDMECYAYAFDRNGRKVTGPVITMKLAKAEGWLDRNGSKWKTMPEVMIRYRAATFFGRLNTPDLIMGIYSTDEVVEIASDQYAVIDSAGVGPERIELVLDEPTEPTPTGGAPAERLDGANSADPQPQGAGGSAQMAIDMASPPATACEDCGVLITKSEHEYSVKKYGRPLCRDHQNVARGG